jgi:predicted nucleic acid-binding protein
VTVVRLVDTNILVYRVDPRDRNKQRRAAEVIERGIAAESLCVSYQSIVEFVAATTRPMNSLGGRALLPRQDALLEAESLMRQLAVLYPTPEVLTTGMRGMTMYGISWFDALIWAAAEVHGVDELLSEDFQHGRHYGRIRVVDPFLDAEDVHELPAMYRTRGGRPGAGSTGS